MRELNHKTGQLHRLSRRGFIIGVLPVGLTACGAAVPPAISGTVAAISFLANAIQITQFVQQILAKPENADLPASVRSAPENSVVYSNAEPPQILVRIRNDTKSQVVVPKLDVGLYEKGSSIPIQTVSYPGIIEMDPGVDDVLPDKLSFSHLVDAASFVGRIDATQQVSDFHVSALELIAVSHEYFDRIRAIEAHP